MTAHMVTFGGLGLTVGADAIDWLHSQQLKAGLLVYLAVERTATRDTLQAMFWPEVASTQSARRLIQLTYELRRALGDAAIETLGRTLTASKELVTDVAEFEAAAAAGHYGDALGLYRGPFLSGVHLVDSNAFESWVDSRRTRHARDFRKVCRAHLEECLGAGDETGALAVAQAWVGPDPLDDEAQHRLISLLAQCYGRADALEQYQLYCRLLEIDGLAPLEQTRDLAATIEASVERKRYSPANYSQRSAHSSVRRIRVVLERVQILDDKDPWILGEGEFVFTAEVMINDDPVRGGRWIIPREGAVKISDKAGRNTIDIQQPVFDGAVETGDRLRITLGATELDLLTPDDECTRYVRTFNTDCSSWIGSYGPFDEADDAENMKDWRVWYRIEDPSESHS